jgi:hypothetical protein
MVAQALEPVPRTFAEFPLTRAWESLRQHLSWLDGAQETAFGRRGGICWLHFGYRGFDFQMCEHGTRVELLVEDIACAEKILDEVSAHFGELLCPRRAW